MGTDICFEKKESWLLWSENISSLRNLWTLKKLLHTFVLHPSKVFWLQRYCTVGSELRKLKHIELANFIIFASKQTKLKPPSEHFHRKSVVFIVFENVSPTIS
jgi:hypothetical protein